MKDLNHFYTSRKNEFAQKCEQLKSQIRNIAFARIGIALLILTIVYFGFSQNLYFYFIIPLAVVFLFLVSRHGKIQNQFDIAKNLEKLNLLEGEALQNNYSSFGYGQRFSNPHHAYSYDLDLFGEGSLFQYLNRCGTTIGEEKLAFDLTSPCESKNIISARQEAIQELSGKIDFRQWFWAKGRLLHDDTRDNQEMFNWLVDRDVVLGKRIYTALLVFFPAISVLLIALTIYNTIYFPLLFVFAGIQWTILSFRAKEVSKAEQALSHHQKLIDKYAELLARISSTQFGGKKLKEIQEEAQEASGRIKRFSQLVNAFESRKNAIANLFGNSLYLYDLQCLYRLEKWRSVNGDLVKGWLEKIAEMDALISLSTFHFNKADNTFPEIGSELAIHGDAMSHPLIPESDRVANSFVIGAPENIMLITGANMAGKSTFLRTVGVNLVLALSGSSVCAKKFVCPITKLFTSMRATDSLVDHQSYFYAELSRLKVIMEAVRTNAPILVLLDEILRGTNSKDKHEGSVGLIKQFTSHKALVMLASHDVELGVLENRFSGSIRNYCFESEIKNDALVFDYLLQQGVAHKANATFLMEQMGILPTVKP